VVTTTTFFFFLFFSWCGFFFLFACVLGFFCCEVLPRSSNLSGRGGGGRVGGGLRKFECLLGVLRIEEQNHAQAPEKFVFLVFWAPFAIGSCPGAVI
jgi:hypothetical protein